MNLISGKFVLLLLFILPTTILLAGNDGVSMVVRAEEDELMEEEDDEGVVEDDEGVVEDDDLGAGEGVVQGEEVPEEAEDTSIKQSPDADTFILFTKPTTANELPAGKPVRFLVGFTNTGDKEFMVESMEASFRYPQDYSFYIQNFTTMRYNHVVSPSREATFAYTFTPSETFNARPFGLSINLHYKDMDGNVFQDAVFNETISIVEPDEGLDGETFFMYVFLAAVAVLVLVGAQQLLVSISKKRGPTKSKPAVEMGTQDKGDIDLDWIPEETLNRHNRASPKLSPRQRRLNKSRSAGSSADE